MSSILDAVEQILGIQAKTVSPIPSENQVQNGPQFVGGTPAITRPQVQPFQTEQFPGENAWLHEHQGALGQNPKQLEKTYFNASTAPGGINALPTPTPTPTPAPLGTTPGMLATIPNDPGEAYNPIIEKAAQESGVPAPLLKGVLAHESMQFAPQYVHGYHTDGTGRGVAALDKNAHPEITDQQAFDPSFAIPYAAKLLANYKDQEGNWINALRRYNGGGNYNSQQPGFAGVPVAERTQDYANNVLRQAQRFTSGTNNTDNTSQTP